MFINFCKSTPTLIIDCLLFKSTQYTKTQPHVQCTSSNIGHNSETVWQLFRRPSEHLLYSSSEKDDIFVRVRWTKKTLASPCQFTWASRTRTFHASTSYGDVLRRLSAFTVLSAMYPTSYFCRKITFMIRAI